MHRHTSLGSALLLLVSFLILAPTHGQASATAKGQGPAKAEKEWTFLTFINGHNNLDSYGALNINQMEQVGSTDKINLVVQWASLRNSDTRRMLVIKDNQPKVVTSPVVESMKKVDMGDWKNLVEFVRWGVTNYPAKKYFINVWNHGSGWHKFGIARQALLAAGLNPVGFPDGIINPTEISSDDLTGHSISTLQLGMAMEESAKIIGHKVDLYGSDACLMGMIEIAREMSPWVQVYAGSQDLEPAAGWPYHKVLERWNALPESSPQEVAKILSQEYTKSYTGSSQVTFSAFDLDALEPFMMSIKDLGDSLRMLKDDEKTKVIAAANKTQKFFYSDYADVGDYLLNIQKANVAVSVQSVDLVMKALKNLVIANDVTSGFARAQGVAIWVPSSATNFKTHQANYQTLQFDKDTAWSEAFKSIHKVQ